MMRFKLSAVLALVVFSEAGFAHQPVMDMAPRWDGGYGWQTRIEHFDSRTTTWVEGVYTWDKSIRATLKLPVRAGRADELILGLPLKRYNNDGATTSNFSVTPSIQLPTTSDGERDWGLSVSYSTESPSFYQLYDLYMWEDRAGLDVNFGFAFPQTGGGRFALWDVSLLQSDDGDRIQTGPVFVYFKRNVMFRAEYKALVYERDSNWSGSFFNIGIGFVY